MRHAIPSLDHLHVKMTNLIIQRTMTAELEVEILELIAKGPATRSTETLMIHQVMEVAVKVTATLVIQVVLHQGDDLTLVPHKGGQGIGRDEGLKLNVMNLDRLMNGIAMTRDEPPVNRSTSEMYTVDTIG